MILWKEPDVSIHTANKFKDFGQIYDIISLDAINRGVTKRLQYERSPLPDHWEKNAIAMMTRIRRRLPLVLYRPFQPTFEETTRSANNAALISSNSYSTSGSSLETP
jgi:hypothetical protein